MPNTPGSKLGTPRDLANGTSKNLDNPRLSKTPGLSKRVPQVKQMRAPKQNPLTNSGPKFVGGGVSTAASGGMGAPGGMSTPGFSKGGVVPGVPHVGNKVLKSGC